MKLPSHPCLGSQLFINRYDPPEKVEGLVRKMAKARFCLIRLFIQWDHIEPKPGTWTWEPYDTVFRVAEELSMGIVPTLMSVSPPGWMRRTRGPQDIGPIDDPGFLEKSEAYIRRVVERWRNEPALHSWILWNEPSRAMPRTATTSELYAEFLRGRYKGEISRYNRLSFRQYESFEQITEPVEEEGLMLKFSTTSIDRLDWIRFGVANLCDHLRRIRAIVRSLDKDHPVHLNPHRVSQTMLEEGQSLWEEGKIVDFMGCSAHPAWHSTRFPRERWHQSIAMFADLARSCTPHPEEHFWISELQAGTTVFSGTVYDCPNGTEFDRWLWESIAAGARAVMYWCFNSRHSGYEAGEWSLTGQAENSTDRLTASIAVAKRLEDHAHLFSETRPPQPEVLILHSESALLLGRIDGQGDDINNPRNCEMAADAVCGAYSMMADLGREVQFVNEDHLIERRWPSCARTLILPGCTALKEGALGGVRAFAEAGGTVIADGLIAWKTPDGELASDDTQNQIKELFGAELTDIQAVQGPFMFYDLQERSIPGWFLRMELRMGPHSQTLAKWSGYRPAVSIFSVGSGQTIRIATILFQRYLSQPEPASRAFIERLLPVSTAPLRIARPSAATLLRCLQHPQGVVAIAIKGSADESLQLIANRPGELLRQGRKPIPLSIGQSVVIDMPVNSAEILHFVTAS